ncbi:MAG: flagellar FlbD family protein [Acidobacteriaceae bacterium]
MIPLTRLNGVRFWLNAEIVKTLEASPDTMISLTTGEKLLVRETIDEVCGRVIGYRRRLFLKESEPAADDSNQD